MNRYLRLFSVFILAVFGIASYPGSSQGTTPPAGETLKGDSAIVQEINAGYIENITFDKLPGRERVIISVSRRVLISLPSMPLVAVEDRSSSVLLRMEDMYVPDHLRRPLGENVLGNIIRVVPQQVSHEGKQWVHLLVELKERAPYSVRRDGGNVLLDFHVAALADKVSPAPTRARVDGKAVQPAITDPQRTLADEKLAKEPARREGAAAAQLISLDFQEANIKSVLRLLSEMAGLNIVSGEDVKGPITVHLRNVSWEQALDVILDVSALSKRQTGNVITVMTMERMKKEEAERASLLEAQRRAEQDRKKAELEKEKERLALEKERLEMEVRVQAEKERPVVKLVEPSTDVFVDTDIRRVFQLLAEESRKRGDMISIVAGDDVKGALTADFKEVPWEHKLDTILEIKSLAKRRAGNVITVMTAERMKKEESERAAAELARRKTEQEHREKEQKILAEQMKIDQAKRKEEEALARPPLLTRVISISYADPKALKENLQ
ncbi:MAG: secretin and TonB N-terminal domain-containing protein, partial [Smithellaceae bacterium]|nr:secretin and TonB N-terminal domain-containing protein [Smithellaceae bacterium]